MPNIATLLKDEISRLSRREIRKEVQPLRKASAQSDGTVNERSYLP